jgi:hypothetical protein
MRDLFYTILVVWILWRIISSVNRYRSKPAGPSAQPRPKDDIRVEKVPEARKKMADNEGEYVDYEELK